MYVDIASMGDSLPLPRSAAAALAADGARPLIFALTQPGAVSPKEAYEATDGRCVFADRELVCGGLWWGDRQVAVSSRAPVAVGEPTV